jgi:DNA-binding transcriptional MerR regulator
MMMTMTMTSSEVSEIEIQEMDSHPDLPAEQSELPLNDLNFVEAAEKKPTAHSEPVSLPAALVDDKLLEEINDIPDKMGFKIGDVAELLDVKQYVLRYWESEFDLLRPKKAANNQRMYTRKDVENAFLIRKLLYRDRFSIEGARQVLREFKTHVRREKDYSLAHLKMDSASERLHKLAEDVRRIRQLFR